MWGMGSQLFCQPGICPLHPTCKHSSARNRFWGAKDACGNLPTSKPFCHVGYFPRGQAINEELVYFTINGPALQQHERGSGCCIEPGLSLEERLCLRTTQVIRVFHSPSSLPKVNMHRERRFFSQEYPCI